MNELAIDPALWVGNDLAARLAAHFTDIRTVDAFRAFVAGKRAGDHTAELVGWRRIYDRYGLPVLVAVVVWKGKRRLWRFPLLSTFVAPDDGQTYLVFDAALPRIRLDLGIALRQDTFAVLPGVGFAPPDG